MTNARDKANIPVLNFQSKGIDDNADATAITIDSSERVGLNTTTPGAKLEINSTGNYYNTANQHQQWSYNGTPFLSLYMDAYASPYFDTDSTSSWNPGATMVFKRQGSEKMRITSDGKIGIGTSNPSEQIEISGTGTQTLKIDRTDASSSGAITINSANNSNYIYNLTSKNLILGTDNNARLTVDGTGNVGINTISPDHLLHISASSSNSQLKLQRTGSATASYNISASSDALAFSNQVAGSEVMRINSTGLGIGTSSPSRKLHIVSSDNQLARFESTDTYGGIELCDNTSGTAKPLISAVANDFVFYRGGSSHTVAFGATSVGFGVGTASPSRALTVSGSTAPILALVETGTSGSSSVFFGDSGADNIGKIQYLHSSNDLAFTVNASERMRITSNGNVLFSTTSTPNTVVGSSGAGMAYEANGFLGIARIGATLILNRRNTHGDNAVFRYDGNTTGSISVTSNTTAYNTSSDYRLKENVSYDFDATTRLKQLKPARFNFISDADKTVDGFLAHEVSSIVPEAINGTKDAVDEDGNPEYQGIDQSKLVPLLVKTIQELEARITTLEANNP